MERPVDIGVGSVAGFKRVVSIALEEFIFGGQSSVFQVECYRFAFVYDALLNDAGGIKSDVELPRGCGFTDASGFCFTGDAGQVDDGVDFGAVRNSLVADLGIAFKDEDARRGWWTFAGGWVVG